MSAFLEEEVLSVHHWTDRLFSFTTTRDPALRFSNGHFTMIGLKGENGKNVIERVKARIATLRLPDGVTDDAAAAAERVREAGGQVAMDAFDVLGAGRMAVLADAEGNPVPPQHPPSAELVTVVDHEGREIARLAGGAPAPRAALGDLRRRHHAQGRRPRRALPRGAEDADDRGVPPLFGAGRGGQPNASGRRGDPDRHHGHGERPDEGRQSRRVRAWNVAELDGTVMVGCHSGARAQRGNPESSPQDDLY